jgi:nucleoside-diphosphate-sugar epimerase
MVTGAEGLLGSHVVRALVDAGAARVLAVVRREARPTSEHLRWVSADLRQVAEVQALAGNGVDVIVHAAAVLPKTLDDHSAADSNRAMDRNILSLADAMGASLIYTSSLSVYEGCASPWTESLAVRPVSAYAAGKHLTEVAVGARRLPSATLRVSSPYGASDINRGGVLYHFAREAVAGRPLVVAGDGRRAQDFVHAADIARAVVMLVGQWREHPAAAASGIFNIASGRPVSMSRLAELVVSCSGSGQVVHQGQEAEPDYCAEMVISRAAQVLQWQPKVALRAGLAQLIRHMRGAHEDWLAV